METDAWPAASGCLTFRLPAVIRRYRWAPTYLLVWGPYIAAYQVVNHIPLNEPFHLDFTWVDRMVPFMPELIPLYVAYIPFYVWTLYRSENDREANRVFYATHLQLALSLPFFIFYPVQMPREMFYSPEHYGWADTFWRWFDAPNNCFPSLHVSNCLMLIRFNWNRSYAAVHTVAAVLIIVSTLVVKQHYAVDLAGGAGVYLVSVWFLNRLEVFGVDKQGWLSK